MARKFSVLVKLSDDDLPAFDTLMNDRRTTIDHARRWLAGRGYNMSRTAIWNYAKRQRPASQPGGPRSKYARLVREAAALPPSHLAAVLALVKSLRGAKVSPRKPAHMGE